MCRSALFSLVSKAQGRAGSVVMLEQEEDTTA